LASDRACDRRGIERRYETQTRFRAGKDKHSKFDHTIKYGWWAFYEGNRQMALRFGIRSVLGAPWRLDGWRLLACAALKRIGRVT
jgi:hypothetical protein